MNLDNLIDKLVQLRDEDPNRGSLPVYLDGSFTTSDVLIDSDSWTDVEVRVNII